MKIAPRIAVDPAFAAQRQKVDRAQNATLAATRGAAADTSADIVDFARSTQASAPEKAVGPSSIADNPTLLSLALQSDPQGPRQSGAAAPRKAREVVGAVDGAGGESDLLHVALSTMLSAQKAFY